MKPTLDLFFSLYRLKSIGAQVYFDGKPGYPKLVSTPSSNSGWNSRWAWYEGCEVVEVSPWSRLSSETLKVFSETGSMTAIDLAEFCGHVSRFKASSFSDVRFLCNHCLVGPKLQLLVNSQLKMPSESFLRLLAKKKVGVGASGASEVRVKESDLDKIPMDTGAGDFPDALGIGAKDSKVDVAPKEKKRHRDHGSSRSHHHKKHKDASRVVVLVDSDPVLAGLVISKKDGLDIKVVGSKEQALDKGK
ncbi:uncharacterized protein LOC141710997 [Apium graveolens]|uniref:uncharacterized protein LOC141710997 n=1 Tax=Apium graveolens TaxID=4045 RepID=UPI003D7B3AC4